MFLHQIGLPLNLFESLVSSAYATASDYHQDSREAGHGNCRSDRPHINERPVIFISLVFVGFLWSVYVPLGINDNRRFLSAALEWFGIACAESGIVFFIATGFFPNTWGMSPRWLPAQWRTCQQSHRNQGFSHTENVSQKLLRRDGFVYYNKCMANVLNTDKQIAVFSPDWDFISTSYVERLNATARLHMKRLARLTRASSKKRENFEAAVGLHFAYYNSVRRHNTLRCTPALALSSHSGVLAI